MKIIINKSNNSRISLESIKSYISEEEKKEKENKNLKGWAFIKITTFVIYKLLWKKEKKFFDIWRENAGVNNKSNVVTENNEEINNERLEELYKKNDFNSFDIENYSENEFK